MAVRTLRIVRSADDPAPPPPDRLLTVEQVAERLAVSRSTAYEMARRRAIPTVRIPGSNLVRVSERQLEQWIGRGGAPVGAVRARDPGPTDAGEDV